MGREKKNFTLRVFAQVVLHLYIDQRFESIKFSVFKIH